MANQTIYPFGTEGTLPANIGVVNDVYTGGAGKALSADMGKYLNEQINDITEIDLSDYTAQTAFINNSTGKWQVVSGYTGIFLPVHPGEKYLLYPNSDNGSAYALLTDNTFSDGGTPSYVDGGSRINFGSFKVVTIPADGKYLYIATHSNVDMTPSSVEKETSKVADADFTRIMPYSLDMNALEPVRAYPNPLGKWVTDAAGYPYYGVFIPCRPGQQFAISSNEITRYCFLTSDSHIKDANVNYATGYSGAPSQLPRGSATVTAPSDAAFLYIVASVNGLSTYVWPSIIRTDADTVEQIVTAMDDKSEEKRALLRVADSYGNQFRKLGFTLDENGYEVADSLQILNVLRKAAQFTNIKWTTKGAVPKSRPNAGSWSAGTTITGLPYSSCKGIDKEVMVDVSLHTFMTAVNNPYSLLYTENVSAANSQSAWGKTYYEAGYAASYYGTVCTVLSAMCTGFRTDYISNAYKWLAETFRAVKLYDQSAQGLMLGDIIWKSGHCRVVTGLKRDTDGTVLRVKFSESVTDSATTVDETASAFNSRLASENAILYRSILLYKNIDYVPSPYVAVYGEQEQTVIYNDDICCFAGDKATFREGDTIAINYNLESVGDWTEMEIYKDGTLLDTITIDPSVHYVDLTSLNLTYGKYKARMKNGSTYSDYTYWEILKTTVSFKVFGGMVDVTFSSDGKPVECRLGTRSGGVYAQYEFTEKEVEEGRALIDFVKLNKEQGFSTVIGKSSVLLKVFFKGEYGRVTNEPTSIYFELNR